MTYSYQNLCSFRGVGVLAGLLLIGTACDDSAGDVPTSGPPGAMISVDMTGIGSGEGGSSFVIPAIGGKTSTTNVVAGSLGTACESDADCKSPLLCHSDTEDYIGHKQCTTPCSTSDTCEASFGETSFCIGAGICVRGCLVNSDCTALTLCNDAGWCKRSGPGSGIPKCTGTATPCSLLSGLSCLDSLGCTDSSRCSGISTSCYSLYSSYTCSSQDGCYWSSSSSSCSGSSYMCSSFSSSGSCGLQEGCSWTSSCTGVPLGCDDYTPGTCYTQPGCYTTIE